MRNRRPVLFVRTGWMKHYKGDEPSDELLFAGSEIEVDEYNGHEASMFLDLSGRVYGGFWPGWQPKRDKIREVHIEKLGADKRALFVDHIDVVFVAHHPELRGLFAVGYYRDARVYRHLQVLPDEIFEYNVTTRAENAVAISIGKRRAFEEIDWRQGLHRFYNDANAKGFAAILKHLGL